MANPEHLELARLGRDAWNKWRRRHPQAPADFARADFTLPENRKISFAGFELGAKADFSHCLFGGADHRAVAARDLSPYAPEVAEFLSGGAWFYGARFADGASFAGARFEGVALFQGASFGRDARFDGAAFLDEANFVGAQFRAGASFAGTVFAKLMQFERARFGAGASFAGAAAPADAFPELVLRHARFGGAASFAARRFLARADLSYAAFDLPPDFAGTGGRERLDFQGTRFRLRAGFVPGWTADSTTLARVRLLRGVAREAHAADAERDLFVLERKAERGVAWRNAAAASWAEPLRKAGLYGRALAGTLMMSGYGLFSDCGRSLVRPALWLALANAGAYFGYKLHAKPATTAVGRAARGTWGWMKSWFVTPPPSAATTSSSLSSEQQRSLFEFWWSSAVPGSVTRAAYEKAARSLFGGDVIPLQVYLLQFGHLALNVIFVLLIALAVRNHFRVPRA
jgi:uncharacterized protein YjbI with pentapeptide repeats